MWQSCEGPLFFFFLSHAPASPQTNGHEFYLCLILYSSVFRWPEEATEGISEPGVAQALWSEGLVGRLPALAQTSHVLV